MIIIKPKLTLTALLFLCYSYSFGQNHVSFTIDDLPFVSYGVSDSVILKDRTNSLVQKLNAYKIPAIGFVNERKLYLNGSPVSFQVGMLNIWIEHGLELGNHTFSHIDYNSTSLKNYGNDILRGEKTTRKLLERKNIKLTYFRHPFLHTGNSKAKSDSLNDFLTQHKYKVAPVTIDNDDYIFALAYHRAITKNDSELALRIGRDYISYMEKKLKYYENQSNALFGRNISHTLLLHANALNADYIDSLAIMYQRNNYDFVTLEQALQDKAYESEITHFGNWGISWIDRWALSAGKKSDFFKDEPKTPDYIIALAN